MSEPKALLMVMMEPSPGDEQEFHDFYDTELVPARAALPGFLSAQRFVCIDGWPRYFAIYDLAYINVLSEPAYLAASGIHFSPWAKRILARVHGLYRAEGIQVYPGDAVTGAKGKAARLVVWRFRGVEDTNESEIVRGLHQVYDSQPELLQFRLFRSTYEDVVDHLALVELQAPVIAGSIDPKAFGSLARHIDILNIYTPYWRRGYLRGIFSK